MDITIPIAEAVGAEALCAEEPSSLLESLNHSHRALCETIKLQRDNFSDFCEDDEERDNALKPIEQDPEPYSNGTIKTRPILKKYAKSLCEKLELEERMEATEESLRDTDLTPQQVKLDMKRYVAMSEKKIANQQEQIERLNDKLEQLTQAIALIAGPSNCPSKLSTAMNLNLYAVENLLLERNINGFNKYDILFATSIKSIEKLLSYGLNINEPMGATINMPGRDGAGKTTLLGTVIDDAKKYCIPVYLNADCSVANLGPYSPAEMPTVYSAFVVRGDITCHGGAGYAYPYELTPLKIATLKGSIELTKFLVENGAKIGDTQYHTPNGTDGDLVAGYLQTRGSNPVIRF